MLSRISRIRTLLAYVAPVIAILFMIPGASLAQSDVCIPSIGGLASAPTIDGRVEGDPGWNGAARLNLKQPMGVLREGTVQFGIAGGFLYMSFELEGTPTPQTDDLVVLGISSTSAANDWRIHISPFTVDDITLTPVYQNHDPKEKLYWRNSSTWNLNTSAGGTANTPNVLGIGEIKVSRNINNWAMEVKLPISTNPADASGIARLYLPPSPTTFNLYVNVLSTFDLGGTFTQDPWPQGSLMLTAGAPGSGGNTAANRTPGKTIWATASTFARDPCKGVYLAWNGGVGVRQTPAGTTGYTSLTANAGGFRAGGSPTGALLTTAEQCETEIPNNDTAWPGSPVLPTNYFVAKPGNDGTAPAPRVYARFYVAPWGIPGAFDAGAPDAYWHPVGELYRPTTGVPAGVDVTAEATIPVDVAGAPALPSHLITQQPWRLSYKQACVYTKSYGYGMLGHHCMQAEVHSNDPAVRIRNKSIQINHNFVEASVVLRDAKISLKGHVKPGDKGSREVILLSHKLVQTFNRDGAAFYPVAPKGQATTERMLALTAANLPAQFRALGPVPADRYPKGITEGMTVVTNGYLKTNDSMVIGGRSYRYAQYLGGFSYFAGHAGVAKSWNESIALAKPPAGKAPSARGKAATLQPLDVKALQARAAHGLPTSAYALQFGDEDTVTLAVTAEAQEEGAKPGETSGTKPPCGCLDFGCRAQADAGGAMTVAGLFLVGGIGAGGLAFVRRRKGKPEKAEDDKRQS